LARTRYINTSHISLSEEYLVNSGSSKERLRPTSLTEGSWTYLYFSYSHFLNKAVAMLAEEHNEVQRTELKPKLQQPTTLRFTLAGSDVQITAFFLQNNFRGFNGQFSSPVLRIGKGSFLYDEDELAKFTIACNPKPRDDQEFKVVPIIDNPRRFLPVDEQEGVLTTIENTFAKEYAVSGWFQWSCRKYEPQVFSHIIYI
jgi:hypothetical protein